MCLQCVVFGAGLVGLGAVAGCRIAGAERIVCVDLSEDRLEMARGQGATDYTFEATGSVKVMRQAVESARMGWGLCTVAGVAGRGEVLEVVPRQEGIRSVLTLRLSAAPTAAAGR